MDRGAWQATVHGVAESVTTEATWHTGTSDSINRSQEQNRLEKLKKKEVVIAL